MGIKEAALPLVLFVVAICGIAQSAITINAYLTSNKPKDSSYNFSMMILVVSICLLFGSGYFAYKKFQGVSGVEGAAQAAADAVNQSAEQAALETAKLAGAVIPTLNEVKAAVPNVKALPNIATARSAQANFNAAVKNVVGKLEELQTSINGRIADKLKALQAVQTAAATAAAAAEASAA
jgi:hypothetical protein